MGYKKDWKEPLTEHRCFPFVMEKSMCCLVIVTEEMEQTTIIF